MSEPWTFLILVYQLLSHIGTSQSIPGIGHKLQRAGGIAQRHRIG